MESPHRQSPSGYRFTDSLNEGYHPSLCPPRNFSVITGGHQQKNKQSNNNNNDNNNDNNNRKSFKPPSSSSSSTRIAVDVFLMSLVIATAWYFFFHFRKQRENRRKRTNNGKDQDCKVPKTNDTYLAETMCEPRCKGIHYYEAYGPTQLPLNNGKKCTAKDMRIRRNCKVKHGPSCNQPCKPGNKKPDQWSPCPDCMPSGSNKRQQIQVVPPQQDARGNYPPCKIGDILKTRDCPPPPNGKTLPPCNAPPQNCQRSDKPVYTSPCSNPCGAGKKWVVYDIKHPAKHGGQPCMPTDLAHYVPCHGDPKSSGCKHSKQHHQRKQNMCKNCGGWSKFGRCDVPCGGGKQFRLRTDNSDCPTCPQVDKQQCNTRCCDA